MALKLIIYAIMQNVADEKLMVLRRELPVDERSYPPQVTDVFVYRAKQLAAGQGSEEALREAIDLTLTAGTHPGYLSHTLTCMIKARTIGQDDRFRILDMITIPSQQK